MENTIIYYVVAYKRDDVYVYLKKTPFYEKDIAQDDDIFTTNLDETDWYNRYDSADISVKQQQALVYNYRSYHEKDIQECQAEIQKATLHLNSIEAVKAKVKEFTTSEKALITRYKNIITANRIRLNNIETACQKQEQLKELVDKFKVYELKSVYTEKPGLVRTELIVSEEPASNKDSL